jgi:HSP20 family protein
MKSLVPFNGARDGVARSDAFDDLGNMVESFFGKNWFYDYNVANSTFKMDVREDENSYTIEAELPGVRKDEIALDVNDQTLSISVRREEQLDRSGINFVHRERRSNSMGRSVRLLGTQLDQIKAKLEDGVLRISVPKQKKDDKKQKINIE